MIKNKITVKEILEDKYIDFIKNRYGEKNMVSATIHFDEKTPHMHINFVPVTKDGRLSAKDLFSPKDLRTLQDDFNKYINDKGYNLERGKADSKRKHISVEEFKLEKKQEDILKASESLSNGSEQLSRLIILIELKPRGACLEAFTS